MQKKFISPGAAVVGLIALVAVLNYFDIVSLPEKNFGFLPKRYEIDTAQPVPASQTGNTAEEEGIILAASLRKDYVLYLTDAPGLATYFDDFDIWDKRYNEKVQKDTLPTKKALILLTDDKNQVIKTPHIYSLGFKDDAIVITVYLAPDVLNSAAASQNFGNAVVYALSKVNNVSNADFLLKSAAGRKFFQISRAGAVPPASVSSPSAN